VQLKLALATFVLAIIYANLAKKGMSIVRVTRGDIFAKNVSDNGHAIWNPDEPFPSG
jgi:hypothetical protein